MGDQSFPTEKKKKKKNFFFFKRKGDDWQSLTVNLHDSGSVSLHSLQT